MLKLTAIDPGGLYNPQNISVDDWAKLTFLFYTQHYLELTDGIDDQLELLVLVFVVVLGVLVQYGHVDAAQNDLQVEAGGSRQSIFDLKKVFLVW